MKNNLKVSLLRAVIMPKSESFVFMFGKVLQKHAYFETYASSKVKQ